MKNNIKIERAKSNMTQQELSEKVGVSRQTINYIETQRYIPSAVVTLKIAHVLNVRVDELFILEKEDWI